MGGLCVRTLRVWYSKELPSHRFAVVCCCLRWFPVELRVYTTRIYHIRLFKLTRIECRRSSLTIYDSVRALPVGPSEYIRGKSIWIRHTPQPPLQHNTTPAVQIYIIKLIASTRPVRAPDTLLFKCLALKTGELWCRGCIFMEWYILVMRQYSPPALQQHSFASCSPF